MAYRTIHRTHHHFGWDRSIEPALRLEPGTALELDVIEASAGRITPHSPVSHVADLDPAYANPVTGPIHIDGAEPGDMLWVQILDFGLSGWGWTAIIPEFGLLERDFPDPFLNISRHDAREVEFCPGVRVPTQPFPGTIGVAPAERGRHSAIPPRPCGGNLDMRHLRAGSRLGLPVQVPGALFSVGDTHAAQGDGEVCGTAVESPMQVALRFDLEKGAAARMPRAELPACRGEAVRDSAYSVTMGVGPDLHDAARDAVREMIDLLTKRHGLGAELAYCLCSAAVDLRLSEVVNAPNWVVSAYLPHDIFD